MIKKKDFVETRRGLPFVDLVRSEHYLDIMLSNRKRVKWYFRIHLEFALPILISWKHTLVARTCLARRSVGSGPQEYSLADLVFKGLGTAFGFTDRLNMYVGPGYDGSSMIIACRRQFSRARREFLQLVMCLSCSAFSFLSTAILVLLGIVLWVGLIKQEVCCAYYKVQSVLVECIKRKNYVTATPWSFTRTEKDFTISTVTIKTALSLLPSNT